MRHRDAMVGFNSSTYLIVMLKITFKVKMDFLVKTSETNHAYVHLLMTLYGIEQRSSKSILGFGIAQ